MDRRPFMRFLTQRTYRCILKALSLATAGAFLSSSLAYGLAPPSLFETDASVTHQRLARIVGGLRHILQQFEMYFQEAKEGGVKGEITELFKKELGYRRAVIEAIEGGTAVAGVFKEATARRPRSIRIYWTQYNEEVWMPFLKKSEPKRADTLQELDFRGQLEAVMNDPEAKAAFQRIISNSVIATERDRYGVENRVIQEWLRKSGVANPVILDRGAANGVTSFELHELVGGRVISVEHGERPPTFLTALMLARGMVYPPSLPSNGGIEWRNDDFTEVRYADLDGKINVVRDGAVLVYLDRRQYRKAIGDVFKYAQGNPKGLLYHATHGSHTYPVLLSQLMFHIKGSDPRDWELIHAGFLFQDGGHDRSSLLTNEELYRRETAISDKVLAIRNALLVRCWQLAGGTNVFDEFGNVRGDIRDALVSALFPEERCSQDETQDIFAHMVKDILLISPWTYETDYTGYYYEEHKVHARHELVWKFVGAPRDIDQLLTQLLERVRVPQGADTQALPPAVSVPLAPIAGARPELGA